MSILAKLGQLPLSRAAAALLLLIAVGALTAPGTVTVGVWQAMLPFVAILGLAALGQHLVIQQGGFDLSVAGVISLAAVIATMPPSTGDEATVVAYVLAALAMGLCVGLLSGLVISVIGVAPIVTTIGMNALLLGATLYFSGGVPSSAPESLISFATGKWIGIPRTFVIFLLVALVLAFVLQHTVMGRRFTAVGTSKHSARMLAIPVRLYQVGTYALAGVLFAVAGVLLAGYLTTPTVFSGNPYMLTTVAAFVVGGNALSNEKGSVMATAIGAAFLIYLDQVLVSLGVPQAIQNIVQAVIVIAGVALPSIVKFTK